MDDRLNRMPDRFRNPFLQMLAQNGPNMAKYFKLVDEDPEFQASAGTVNIYDLDENDVLTKDLNLKPIDDSAYDLNYAF